MAVAAYTDVAIAIGRPITTDDEQNQVEWWLTGIEMLIKTRFTDLTALDQEVLTYVEAEAAAEKVRRHGQRESSITVSVDDGTVTRRYENPVTPGDITDEWWELLDPAKASTAFTINPYGCRQQTSGRRHWWAET